MQQLNTFKTLKVPAHGGACRGLVHLVGNGLFGLDQAGSQPKFRESIDQQAQHHSEAQGNDALRFLDENRGRQKERIFEKAKPRSTLPCSL
jgi:hypothetical protein